MKHFTPSICFLLKFFHLWIFFFSMLDIFRTHFRGMWKDIFTEQTNKTSTWMFCRLSSTVQRSDDICRRWTDEEEQILQPVSETDNPSAGVVMTDRTGGSTWQQPTPLWRRRSCWRSEAWQEADKGVLFLCVLYLSRALHILRTPRGESGLARLHTSSSRWNRPTARCSVSSRRLLCIFKKRLHACQFVWMSCVENECFAHHTRFWFCGFDGQNNACSPCDDGTEPLHWNVGLMETEHWAGTRLQETGGNVEGSSSRGKGRVCQGGLSSQGE